MKVKDLRKDESKYPGLIMEKISFHRWHETRTGVISAKKIYEILNETKKDFEEIPLFSSFEINNLSESEKFLMKSVANLYCEKIKKWFGKQ